MLTAQNRRIRVLYMIGTLGVGGTERQLIQLIRYLDREQFEPTVACMSELGPLALDLEQLGVPVHLYGLKGLRDRSPVQVMKALLEIAGDVRRRAPDIVHAQLFWANVLCGLMSKLGGARILITSRRGLGLFKDGRPNYQCLENMTNAVTAAVIINSQRVGADVSLRERWVRNKIHLIYNGVEWRKFVQPSVPPTEMRLRLGIPVDVPLVGSVANLIPYKGHADLVRAMAQVVQRIPDAHLALVGRDDGTQASLTSLAEELGLTGRVHFLGSRQDVVNCLHSFDVQALASHEEGFSNVILEGMAAGKAIVATDVGGNAEAIVHDSTGFIVPPRAPDAMAAALIDLLLDPERRTAMGLAGQKRAREIFSVETMVRKVEFLYLRLLEGKQGRTVMGR